MTRETVLARKSVLTSEILLARKSVLTRRVGEESWRAVGARRLK